MHLLRTQWSQQKTPTISLELSTLFFETGAPWPEAHILDRVFCCCEETMAMTTTLFFFKCFFLRQGFFVALKPVLELAPIDQAVLELIEIRLPLPPKCCD